jgi:hypothetical protein
LICSADATNAETTNAETSNSETTNSNSCDSNSSYSTADNCTSVNNNCIDSTTFDNDDNNVNSNSVANNNDINDNNNDFFDSFRSKRDEWFANYFVDVWFRYDYNQIVGWHNEGNDDDDIYDERWFVVKSIDIVENYFVARHYDYATTS